MKFQPTPIILRIGETYVFSSPQAVIPFLIILHSIVSLSKFYFKKILQPSIKCIFRGPVTDTLPSPTVHRKIPTKERRSFQPIWGKCIFRWYLLLRHMQRHPSVEIWVPLDVGATFGGSFHAITSLAAETTSLDKCATNARTHPTRPHRGNVALMI